MSRGVRGAALEDLGVLGVRGIERSGVRVGVRVGASRLRLGVRLGVRLTAVSVRPRVGRVEEGVVAEAVGRHGVRGVRGSEAAGRSVGACCRGVRGCTAGACLRCA